MLSQDTPKFQFIMVGTVTAIALCLFALFALLHVHQTIAQDDLIHMVAAQTLRETGTAIHYGYGERIKAYSPELYLQVLTTGFRLFGVSEAVARLPGIMSGLLSIILVVLITNSLSHGTRIERLQWASVVSLLSMQ
jgi:4-amino-4-deoxy-L-arabinose transferase-like glycosyltransferase